MVFEPVTLEYDEGNDGGGKDGKKKKGKFKRLMNWMDRKLCGGDAPQSDQQAAAAGHRAPVPEPNPSRKMLDGSSVLTVNTTLPTEESKADKANKGRRYSEAQLDQMRADRLTNSVLDRVSKIRDEKSPKPSGNR